PPDQQGVEKIVAENGVSLPDAAWEMTYAPYDQPTYEATLARIRSNDIVLDIGAGDLRLSRQMAVIARKVYAVEIDARVLEQAYFARDPLPANLIPIRADARTWDFPSDVTAAVLLMRHCTCFSLYAEKLRTAGATRLITNARWRMSVEEVDLRVRRQSFAEADMGWYACRCGGTGFKEGPVEYWSMELDGRTSEVSDCPHCMENTMSF
ncbi:MAG: rRNA adenine N-6-methyltransferase family protein, partial [Chloroflexota bacterium]